MIYAHHFAKGNAGDRNTIDRGSGAGTFSRDPDAILTMTQIDYINEDNPQRTAWRVEYVLREFPTREPYDVFWDYPVHRPDIMMDLIDLPLQTSLSMATRRKSTADEMKKTKRVDNVNSAARKAMAKANSNLFTLKQFEQEYTYETGLSERTLKRRLEEAGYSVCQQDTGMPALWGSARSAK